MPSWDSEPPFQAAAGLRQGLGAVPGPLCVVPWWCFTGASLGHWDDPVRQRGSGCIWNILGSSVSPESPLGISGHRLCSSEVLICAREIFWFGWFYKALFRTQGYYLSCAGIGWGGPAITWDFQMAMEDPAKFGGSHLIVEGRWHMVLRLGEAFVVHRMQRLTDEGTWKNAHVDKSMDRVQIKRYLKISQE